MTLAEWDAKLKAEGRYDSVQASLRAQEEDRQRHAAEWQRAEAPLVEDLAKVGVHVSSAWDLVNSSAPYPRAVPVLLDHLTRNYPERVREGIARALAVPEAIQGWRTLVDLFQRDDDRSGLTWKGGLACALEVAATDEVADDIILLARDPKHGINREVLIDALARLSSDEAERALRDLVNDPEVSTAARRALKKRHIIKH
ncbi:hypothetical protein KF840_07130 [bacterium]|nr:hypothetical protein [bacterium]